MRMPRPPYVQICRYLGMNGDRATVPVSMYLARIVGVNGKTKVIDESGVWQQPGHVEPRFARQCAAEYAALLGCDVIWTDYRGHEQGHMPPEPKAFPAWNAEAWP